MNKRPLDKSKKSNIKCEHCRHWQYEKQLGAWIDSPALKVCEYTGEPKSYWCRCKKFEWKYEWKEEK